MSDRGLLGMAVVSVMLIGVLEAMTLGAKLFAIVLSVAFVIVQC